MKKYAKSYFVSLLAAIALYTTFSLVYAQVPSARSSWIAESYEIKKRYLSTLAAPRLFLAGGSSLLFGLRSEIIDKKIDKFRSVNYGIHAGLQLPYIFETIRRVAEKGDVVVLLLEYRLYEEEGAFRHVFADYAVSFDKRFAFRLDPWQAFGALLKPIMTMSRVRALFGDTRALEQDGLNRPPAYQSRTQNARGETTANISGSSSGAANWRPKSLPCRVSGAARRAISDFVEDMSGRGVRVLAGWPPYISFAEKSGNSCANYLETFWSENRVTTIGTPRDFMYAPEFFFDTVHHLNAKGAILNTNVLIRHLRRALADPNPR